MTSVLALAVPCGVQAQEPPPAQAMLDVPLRVGPSDAPFNACIDLPADHVFLSAELHEPSARPTSTRLRFIQAGASQVGYGVSLDTVVAEPYSAMDTPVAPGVYCVGLEVTRPPSEESVPLAASNREQYRVTVGLRLLFRPD